MVNITRVVSLVSKAAGLAGWGEGLRRFLNSAVHHRLILELPISDVQTSGKMNH